MSTFTHRRLVEGPFKDSDPIDQLIEFYKANGYTRVEPVSESPQDDHDTRRVLMTRGKKGASIWSSDMTELFAQLTLVKLEDSITIDYDVETTMQHFTEDDRSFWTREANHAEKFLTGKVDQAIDWRGNESARAEQLQRDIIYTGLKLMVLTMIIVFVIAVVAT